MNVVENYMVEDTIRHASPEEREQRRDNLRAEILRYNEDVQDTYAQGNDDSTQPVSYIEPTDEGYFGLEPPIGG